LAALLVIAPASAFAQDAARPRAAEAAATHFRRGVELYDEADFTTALVEFRRAYETLPDFHVLYNIGQTQYQLQRYAHALRAFRRYLDEGGAGVSPVRRAEVEREITRLEGRVARVRVTGDAGIEVFVDDESLGKTPFREPLIVSAGAHRIRAASPGATPFTRAVELAGGDEVAFALPALPATERPPSEPAVPAPEPSSREGGGSVDPVAVGWTVTGILAAGAVGTGIAALGASSDVEEKKRKAPGAVTAHELDSAADRAKTLALVTDILGGAALVAGGVSLWLTLRPKAQAATGASVMLGPRGVVLRAKF
jgi:hypothetical protein